MTQPSTTSPQELVLMMLKFFGLVPSASCNDLHGPGEAYLQAQTAPLPCLRHSLLSLCSFFSLPSPSIPPKGSGMPFPTLPVGCPAFIRAYLPAAPLLLF